MLCIKLLASLLHIASAQRFLVLNDIHLNINQTAYKIPPPGEETTQTLLEVMLQQAKDQTTDEGIEITAILLPGDFNKHGLSARNESIPNPNWGIMLETMTTVMNTIQQYFPGTPVLPAIGNNDCYYHD
jgi:hypothetical protein